MGNSRLKIHFLEMNRIPFPSAKLYTAQHWSSIGKNVAEDRLPISCRCWNDNSGMHLAANAGPNSVRQHLFLAQERPDVASSSGFLNSRMFCRGESDTWPSNVLYLGRILALLHSELNAIKKATIGLV